MSACGGLFARRESFQQGDAGYAEEGLRRDTPKLDAVHLLCRITEHVGHREVHLIEITPVIVDPLLLPMAGDSKAETCGQWTGHAFRARHRRRR